MDPSITAGWDNFFVAEVGASAALTGLVFVAVSINVSRILAFPHLPGRAAHTLLLFFWVLLISSFGLVPGQSARLLGAEILGVAILGIVSASWVQFRHRLDVQERSWVISQVLTSQVPLVPFVVCAVLLLKNRPEGLYWLVGGTVSSFAAGVLNAWVLLVEILR